MKETRTNRKLHKPPDETVSTTDAVQPPRLKNVIPFVVKPKKIKRISHSNTSYPSQDNLIKLTEKLAEDAKSGKLKGLGILAEYDDGFTFGLEGSYLVDPGCAALPLMRLQHRIMTQLAEQD